MFLRKILLLIVIAAICFQIGCSKPEVVAPKVLVPLTIDEEELTEAELKIAWNRRIPIDEKVDSIKQMYVIADRLYVQSTLNQFLCLNRRTGELLYTRTVGMQN